MNPAAADLLRACAFLDPDAIPEELITEGAPELGSVLGLVAADPFKLNEALEAIQRYSLVRRHPETKTLSIHRVVQMVLKDEMGPEKQQEWAERTVKAVNRAFPDVEFSKWHNCQRCLPHVQASITLIEQWNMVFPEAARLLNQAGRYLTERAQYDRAERFLMQAQALYKQPRSAEHLDLATTLNNVAWLHYKLGRYTQAELLYMQAKTLREQALGTEDPAVAQILNDLALVYYNQGSYTQAEPLYQEALGIREKTLGPEHPDVATTRNDMAWFYRNQGKYAQAEDIYQWVLAIRKQVLGPEHLHVATTLNDLAVLYVDQGKYPQAEPLLLQVLAVREQTLGPEHPRVAMSCNNIGWLYFYMGQYAKAESYHLRALTIRKQVLDSKHPHVGRSYNALGEIYHAQGKYKQAEEYYGYALEISQQTTGIKHPLRATYLNNLASLYADQGKYSQAEDLYGQALSIREKPLVSSLKRVLAERPLGLVFDIDGTLSPIALTPGEAKLYPGVVSLLEKARDYAHIAIMTGRAIDNGAAMVNVDGLTYIGSHGLEWSDGLPSIHTVDIVPEALAYGEPGKYLLDLAELKLSEFPDLIVERKRIGGAVHYRLCPEPEQVRQAIIALLEKPARRVNMCLSEGKRVVEIKAPLEVNKGRALRRFVQRFGLQGIVFAGDDRTDLDAILEIPRLRQDGIAAFSIAVEHVDTPHVLLEKADDVVCEVEGMVEILRKIVEELREINLDSWH